MGRRNMKKRILAIMLAVLLVMQKDVTYANEIVKDSAYIVKDKNVNISGSGTAEIKSQVVVPVEPVGHVYQEVTVRETRSTCCTQGERVVKCGRAGCKIHSNKTIILPLDSSNHEGPIISDVLKNATCQETGTIRSRCNACKRTTGTQTIGKISHNENGSTVYVPPTTHSDGYCATTCSMCGKEMSKSIIPRINSGSGSGGSSGSESSSGSGSTSSGGTASGGGQNSQGGNTSSAQTQSSRTVAEKKEATKVVATTGADPIDLFSGAHRIEFPVMSQSGALNIGVSLSYRSDKSVEGVFGKGFSWNYESFVEENEGEIQLYYSPADYVLFSKSSTRDCYTTDAVGSETDELYKNADGSITLECNGKQFDYGINRKLNKVTEKTGESVLIEYKDKEIDLVDGVSGQRIVLLMNERGYVERVSNGASSQALFEYDEKGWLTKYTDSDGFVTSYTYDEEGRVLTGIDGDGNVYFEDIYNEAGKVSKQRDAYGNESTFEYIDKDDNKQETIFTNRLGDTRKYEFDEDGRILLETDEAGNKEESRYDEYGNCVEKIDPLAASIKMEYDNRHNLTKITDEVGNITCYEYDDNDNLVKICYADGSNESYCYDKYNRLESSIDLRGLETVYEYNSDGLLIRSEAGEKVTTYTYENGRVKTISDTIGNTML